MIALEIQKRIDSFSKFPIQDLKKVGQVIHDLRIHSGMLFVAGNGGSSSTAQHFATDIGIGSIPSNSAVRTVNLSDNSAAMTATANDFEYSQVFSRPLSLLYRPGDVVLTFSASGNSENLLTLNDVAKKLGATTISFTGFDGGALKKVSDVNVHFGTGQGEYGLVEDLHLAACHILTTCSRSQTPPFSW